MFRLDLTHPIFVRRFIRLPLNLPVPQANPFTGNVIKRVQGGEFDERPARVCPPIVGPRPR